MNRLDNYLKQEKRITNRLPSIKHNLELCENYIENMRQKGGKVVKIICSEGTERHDLISPAEFRIITVSNNMDNLLKALITLEQSLENLDDELQDFLKREVK